MNWFLFLIGALATYRLSLLISKEDGPAWIFRKLRRLPPPKSSVKQGISCLLCVSLHMSAPVALYFWWSGRISNTDIWLYWLAFSAAAIVIHMKVSKDL